MEGKEIDAGSIRQLIEDISLEVAGKKPDEIYRAVPHRDGFFVLFKDGTWMEGQVVSDEEAGRLADISMSSVEAPATLQ